MGLQSKALFWTLMGGSSTVATSTAVSMLSSEQQGLALDFTDSFFFSRYGQYGSACVKDLGTIANNFNSIPSDLLTYTGTTKLTCQSDGVYRYGPHNLYVNSAAPANQSITVVSGASYSVTITGSVSVTASGAATGTWTAGTTTFTAATATLTLGSTSGSGTVHVRRTPSDSTYLPTTSAARYGLPFEWNTSGVLQGILVEPQATNLLANSTSPASWNGSNFTATRNVTAPDGTATASKFEVTTSSSTTATDAAVVASTSATASIYLKKGSGATDANLFAVRNQTTATVLLSISVNYDTLAITYITGASGASLVAVGGGWYRLIMTVTSGITSGDSVQFYTCFTGLTETAGEYVYLWQRQLETGAVATSPIITYAASATRAADNISLLPSAIPSAVPTGTLFADAMSFQPITATQVYCALSFYDAVGSDRVMIYEYNDNIGGLIKTSSVTQADIVDGTGLTASRQRVKWAMSYATNDIAMVHDGGTVYTDATATIPSAFTKIGVGNLGDGVLYIWSGYIKSLRVVPRRMSNAELQTVTT